MSISDAKLERRRSKKMAAGNIAGLISIAMAAGLALWYLKKLFDQALCQLIGGCT